MDKHKKFHHTLLKIYFPPTPLTMLDSQDPDAQVDPVQVPHMETQLDFDRDLDRTENGCCSNAPDPVTQKLTRAQRKRIKKRKLLALEGKPSAHFLLQVTKRST
ncbi:hypothetical protein HPP92_007631 [Vanilla planifolia]|uniref:Uncharacterized protein n=1 Tax=Vanilla planifolia TaxID=51239 RepID=A0A835RHX1_VANPL|nr:hypothetical protein HPP92_007631 [Vanilla planifolia]